MQSPALLITAFWSLCLLVGAFLVVAGNPPVPISIFLFVIAVFQASAIRGRKP